jgi:hypothetical protein
MKIVKKVAKYILIVLALLLAFGWGLGLGESNAKKRCIHAISMSINAIDWHKIQKANPRLQAAIDKVVDKADRDIRDAKSKEEIDRILKKTELDTNVIRIGWLADVNKEEHQYVGP